MKKQTITEFMAEEIALETGKTLEQVCEEYNVIDANDYLNFSEDYI